MMLPKFKKHIDNHLPFLKEGKLLLAISGGIDSVVLAHLLTQLKLNFSLAHCNFKLRYEDADRDEEFVKQLASKLNTSCFTINFDTLKYAEQQKISTQMAARELRYNWFDELIATEEFDYVLTAHHANDNLETVLINLTRGGAIQRLTGIPEINGKIIRPLLPFTRKQIEQFTIENQIIWREDESNRSTKYFRNKIRHEVIPVLESLNTNLLTTFNEHLSMLKAEQQVLHKHIKQTVKTLCIIENDITKIDIQKLQNLEEPKVYLHYLLAEYGFTDWHVVLSLLTAQSGKMVKSPTHRLLKDRDFLILEKNSVFLENSALKIIEGCTKITKPIPMQFEVVDTVNTANNAIFVDAETIQYPLHLRKKKDGDVFYPFGMKGKKKVSKYFKDEKMSLSDKEHIWLLCNADDSIIWIVNKRLDNRHSITKETNNILKITSPLNQTK